MEKFISTSDLPQYAENLLELQEPELYSCRVWKYVVSHSVMAIIFQRDDVKSIIPIYAVFEDVRYFEGAMWWKGANLKTTSRDEYVKLSMKLQRVPEDVISEIPVTLGVKLFTFDADNVQIKILASLLYLTDDISFLP